MVSRYIDWESLVWPPRKWISSMKGRSPKNKWSSWWPSCKYSKVQCRGRMSCNIAYTMWHCSLTATQPFICCGHHTALHCPVLHRYRWSQQRNTFSYLTRTTCNTYPSSFGVSAKDLPEPAHDWEAFSKRIDWLNENTPMVSNPITLKMSRWIDMVALNRMYAPNIIKCQCAICWAKGADKRAEDKVEGEENRT